VLLDDLVACVRRRIGVHAEGLDAERASHGPPHQRVRDGDLVELLQADGVERLLTHCDHANRGTIQA
jgi:hypothetical protein